MRAFGYGPHGARTESAGEGGAVSLVEDLAGDEGCVQGPREAAERGGVEKRFGNLLATEADVQGCSDVDLELGLTAAERGENPESDQLPAAGIESGTVVDVPEHERGDVVA
jgi:hypothetical protein